MDPVAARNGFIGAREKSDSRLFERARQFALCDRRGEGKAVAPAERAANFARVYLILTSCW